MLSDRRFKTGRGVSSERSRLTFLTDRLLDLLSCDGERLLRLDCCFRNGDRVASICSMTFGVVSESVPSRSVSDESVSLDTGLFSCRCGVLERLSGSFRAFDGSLSDVSDTGGFSTGGAIVTG